MAFELKVKSPDEAEEFAHRLDRNGILADLHRDEHGFIEYIETERNVYFVPNDVLREWEIEAHFDAIEQREVDGMRFE